MSEADDNLTRKFVAEAASTGARNLPLDVNPALAALSAIFVEGAPGAVTIGFTTPVWASQGNGVVGGGTIANMLDSAMAMAVLSALQPGMTCATISLTVNMHRGVLLGDMVVKAQVDRVGRRVAFANAALVDADGNLIANAMSSLAVIGVR